MSLGDSSGRAVVSEWLAQRGRGHHDPVSDRPRRGSGGRRRRSDGSAARSGPVAFRYLADGARPTSADPVDAGGAYPANPNGSVNDIAGICDDSGTIVGLMPHPEDHVLAWQRPSGPEGGSGLPLFEAFVAGAR